MNTNSYINKIYITYNEFGKLLNQLCDKIKDSSEQFYGIHGLPRGGLGMATHISHQLNIPLITNLSHFESAFPNKKLLVVDDIIDSGRNFLRFLEVSSIKNISYSLATLCYKPKALVPEYFALEVPATAWVVFPWEIIDNEEAYYNQSEDIDGCLESYLVD